MTWMFTIGLSAFPTMSAGKMGRIIAEATVSEVVRQVRELIALK